MSFSTFRKSVFPTSHRLILERMLGDYLNQLHGRVLICGSGNDPHSSAMDKAEEVVRTDIDQSIPNIDCVADITALPFEDASFDSLAAIETMEHVSDPVKAISEAHRVLRPGGTLLLSIPFMFHIHADPMDFNRFTKQGIEILLKDFTEVAVKPIGNRWHVISDLVTTAGPALVPLRLVNHLLCLGPLGRLSSDDSASGYVVMARR